MEDQDVILLRGGPGVGRRREPREGSRSRESPAAVMTIVALLWESPGPEGDRGETIGGPDPRDALVPVLSGGVVCGDVYDDGKNEEEFNATAKDRTALVLLHCKFHLSPSDDPSPSDSTGLNSGPSTVAPIPTSPIPCPP